MNIFFDQIEMLTQQRENSIGLKNYILKTGKKRKKAYFFIKTLVYANRLVLFICVVSSTSKKGNKAKWWVKNWQHNLLTPSQLL